MRLPLTLCSVMMMSGCASPAAPDAVNVDDHSTHHAAAPAFGPDAGKADPRMKTMHDMHEKMMAAKTPEERAAMMKEHMKAMQDCADKRGPPPASAPSPK